MEASFYHYILDNPNHNDVFSVVFHSKSLAEWIGDFKGGQWHKTIKEKYSWILERDCYKISFLNGYFDSEGSVENMKKSKKTRYMRCRISIGYWEPAFFLTHMLCSLGIKSSYYIRPSTGMVKDIVIIESSNVINFCNMIDSSIDYKKERIEYIRKIKIIDHSEYIKNLYERYKELIKFNGCSATYKQLIKEGYGDHQYYKITLSRVRNWTYDNQNPLNSKGGYTYNIIFPD